MVSNQENGFAVVFKRIRAGPPKAVIGAGRLERLEANRVTNGSSVRPVMTNCGPTLTDVRDPKIDEKPPPYDCSGCGFSTWSWKEAKRHACGTMRKELRNLTEARRTATSILSALIDSS